MAALDAKTQAELADLMVAISHNPKTRAKVAGVLKDAGLGDKYRFDDVENETTIMARAEQVAKDTLAAERRKSDAESFTARLNSQRASLIKTDQNPNGRFSESLVKDKLEPFMQEKGISDYEDAAILYAHNNPESTPKPEIASRGIWELPTGDWIKDPKGTARQMAHKAVSDIVAARR